MLYAARGAQLICYPGAFKMTTGPLQIALGVIAKDKLFVATCSPARDAAAGYIAWGHSTLIGPFGEVLTTTKHDEATIIAEIDYSQLELRRYLFNVFFRLHPLLFGIDQLHAELGFSDFFCPKVENRLAHLLVSIGRKQTCGGLSGGGALAAKTPTDFFMSPKAAKTPTVTAAFPSGVGGLLERERGLIDRERERKGAVRDE